MKIIKIKDYYGNYQSVPVSDELYEEWRALANETQRIYRKEVYHRADCSFHDIEETYYHNEDPVSNQVIGNDQERRIYEAISKLAPIQQRRIRMLLDGMSCADITRVEEAKYPLLVSGVHDPVLSGATNRFLSENRKPIDRIS